MSRPAWSILNPAKRYYSSAATDLRRTFARVRREQKQGQEANVVQLKRKEKAK
jgi:hypothetical protein